MGRFQMVAKELEAHAVDAVLVTSQPNRMYVTGFRSSAGAAVVTKDGSYFITDCRYIEAASRAVTDATVLESSRSKTQMSLIQQILEEKGVRRLGFEDATTTVSEFNQLKEKLTSVELVPASKIFGTLRAQKSDWEIEQMIKAQRISEKAFTEVLNFIKPGKTEREIAAFLQYQMFLNGSNKISFDPIVVSGKNSSMPHGVPTDKPVEAGDFITMDFGCIYEGYCSDMTRTVAVGHATEEMEKVYHTVLNAQLAGIKAARPGVTGASIHEAAAAVIREAGYGDYFGHGFGHSLGLEIHEAPNAAPTNEAPMPEFAVISAEPGIYLPEKFGVRIEDVIILKGDGCEDITLAPKNLIIL